VKKLFQTKRSFRKEFKRQIRFAIIAAIGFSVAYAWRNVIWSLGQRFVLLIDNSSVGPLSDVWAALAVTFFAVVILFFTSSILKDK
jgi:hypothetical protein